MQHLTKCTYLGQNPAWRPLCALRPTMATDSTHKGRNMVFEKSWFMAGKRFCYVERGQDCSWQRRFQRIDILVCSGDIRDQVYAKFCANFRIFARPKFFFGRPKICGCNLYSCPYLAKFHGDRPRKLREVELKLKKMPKEERQRNFWTYEELGDFALKT